MTTHDIVYIHGYEGSAYGTKARWLKKNYSCFAVDMPDAKSTHPLGKKAPLPQVLQGIKDAVAPSAQFILPYIKKHQPKIIVASSFGTAVWLKLVQEEGLRIPSILLAPACSVLDVGPGFPHDMHTIIIHGTNDGIITLKQAEEIHQKSGPLSLFWPIEDEHRLSRLTTDRPELAIAVEKLLKEQGNEDQQQEATDITSPAASIQ